MNAQKSRLANASNGLRGVFKSDRFSPVVFFENNDIANCSKPTTRSTHTILGLVLLILFNAGCAINYKPTTGNLITKPSSSIIGNTHSVEVLKSNDTTFLFNNARIKKQLLKKGYTSYAVNIVNNSTDTLSINDKTFFAIKNYVPTTLVPEYRVLPLINFNRGLFVSATAYGLVSPFAYAGRTVRFSKGNLLVALPVLGYGLGNSFVAYRSVKRLKKVVDEHYLIGKRVLPNNSLSGFVLVKSDEKSLDFVYRALKN